MAWLQAMKQKLKMTPAKRDFLDTHQKVEQFIRDSSRRQRQLEHEHPKFDEETRRISRDARRKRLEQEHPKLDEKTVDQIVEDMERMPQLLRDAYRKRLQQRCPRLDEATLDINTFLMPMPPQQLVERALIERMHLPEEVRMQEVAMLIVIRHFLP